MKVAVVGGGPAGLYFSYLLKKDQPDHQIQVIEQNPPDATFGFGVVFSDRALEFLRSDDEETHQCLRPHVQSWPDLKIVHKDTQMLIDGNGFASIGRLELLRLLQARCKTAGVTSSFDNAITSLSQVEGVDLVVAADGVNSTIRSMHAHQFGTIKSRLSNPFIWYGTTKSFECLSLTFRENRHGVFCAHHYRYSPKMSTFIVETDDETFNKAGLKNFSAESAKAYCEDVFASDLGGHPLLSNSSTWRRFPLIKNRRWCSENYVLLGDAAHTAYFSIGSGTRLAMEDAAALFRSIKGSPNDIRTALYQYEIERRKTVERLVDAATCSAKWYEQMGTMVRKLEPYEFARSYMIRTGRVNEERLRKIAPKFMASYRKSQVGC